MHQRCRTAVILIGRVGVEDLGNHIVLLRADEDTSFPAGHRIGLLQIREREDIGRIVKVEKRTRIARRLRELMIEIAAPSSRNVCPNPVKDSAPLLIAIKSLIEKCPQKTAALRASIG